MLWRGAAAAADNIEKTGARPFADLIGHDVGIEIVFAEGVGQSGVRVRGDIALGDARHLRHVLTQLVRPERTVEAERQRFGVAQRVIESFRGLAGERTARGVGNGAGDHQRQVDAQRLHLGLHRENRRFGVQRVEYRFDHDDIGAAFDQRARRFAIRLYQLIKGDVAVSGIVDVRRDRAGAVGRAEHAGDVARTMRGFRRPFVAAGARQPGGLEVDLRRQRFHLVIRHRNGGGVKGIGFQNIGARLQIGVVDLADHFRLAEHQQIVVAFEIAGPVAEAAAAKILLLQPVALDHRAHAAVQHHDALRELLMQRFDSVAHSCLV